MNASKEGLAHIAVPGTDLKDYTVLTTNRGYNHRTLNQKRKDNYYAIHYRCCFDRIVAPGASQFLHHGRFYSHSSRHRYCGCLD